MRIPVARASTSFKALLRPTMTSAVVVGPPNHDQRQLPQQQQQQHRRGCGSSKGRKEGMVVIVGATGTGKSKLSIDVATRFPGEVVNADKIQVYAGLDITTNKIPICDRRGVPHHLLGDMDPAAGELSPDSFCLLAASAVAGIVSRRRLPVVAGGSNSLIHALLADPSLRRRCCLLWVHVEGELLEEYLDARVDEMVEAGMVEELSEYFQTPGREKHVGLGKAIGVKEFGDYFGKRRTFSEAVEEIKTNTRRLAEAQVGKIRRMAEELSWPLRPVDATEAVWARLRGKGKEAEDAAWRRHVLGPSLEAIDLFLTEKRLLLEEEEEEEEEGGGGGEESLLLPFSPATELGA
ncbi:adenylate isopentenyltransferase-like [Typha latifolia]|uniref:adenylate isopentenyltransferase-like n=1 Tax=Typha latifolia TaxID=4733 RepID=UPI003C2AADB2